MSKYDDEDRDCADHTRSFGGFFKNLLQGIPWSESAHTDFTFTLDTPERRHMEVHNAKIVTAGDSIDEDIIRALAVKEGMLTLRASAREIVKRGETSIEEVLRVTTQED